MVNSQKNKNVILDQSTSNWLCFVVSVSYWLSATNDKLAWASCQLHYKLVIVSKLFFSCGWFWLWWDGYLILCFFYCLKFLLLCYKSVFFLLSGDARIAKSVKNKVFSFDLVSKDPSVIACDMSNVRSKSILLQFSILPWCFFLFFTLVICGFFLW